MRKGWLLAACFFAFLTSSNSALAGGHVYALRGLINVFSYGMDEMVAKCKRRGVQASAHGHGEYPALAAEAAAKVKSGKGPIIIIGHSYGADAAVLMAEEMKKLGAPVALLVLYGPTVEPLRIPSNVRAVVNYYQTTSAAWRAKAIPGPGFAGSINNVNLDKDQDVTHFNIEKIERLQNQAIARIVALTGTGRPIPTDAPTPAVTDGTYGPTATPPTRAGAGPSRSSPRPPSAKPTASVAPSASASDAKTAADAPSATPAAAPSKPASKPAPRKSTVRSAPVDRLPQHGSF
jgi:hypothetical protein